MAGIRGLFDNEANMDSYYSRVGELYLGACIFKFTHFPFGRWCPHEITVSPVGPAAAPVRSGCDTSTYAGAGASPHNRL